MKLGLLRDLRDNGWSEKELENLILFENLARKILEKEVYNENRNRNVRRNKNSR